MTDKTTIANMALGHIKAGTINDFDEDSVNAGYVRTYYDSARRVALAAFNWGFARKRESLNLLTEAAPSNWLFRYAYPSGCVKLREIEHANGRRPAKPYPFDIELDSAGENKTILCDVEDAVMVYTLDVENTNLFTEEFVDMLAWQLGAYLAIPCGAGVEYEKRCVNWLQARKAEAESMDGNEGQQDDEPDGEFITGRM